MSEVNKNFKEIIVKNLSSNGFPLKKVSLPLEKLYEAADKKGANLNVILEELKAQGTNTEKLDDKIIFTANMPDKLSEQEMMSQAQDMMSKMSPEEIQKIQDMVKNMSPEDQENMMKKAKDMGLV